MKNQKKKCKTCGGFCGKKPREKCRNGANDAQWRDDSPENQRIRELENACKQALEAMQWDVGGEPIYTLEIAAIAELKRVLDC